MNRRSFLSAISGLFSVFFPTVHAASTLKWNPGPIDKLGEVKYHTDIEEWPNYADGVFVGPCLLCDLSPYVDELPLPGTNYIPYLNGKPVRGIWKASAREGWVHTVGEDFTGSTGHRVYGRVQILLATEERFKEFKKRGVWLCERAREMFKKEHIREQENRCERNFPSKREDPRATTGRA